MFCVERFALTFTGPYDAIRATDRQRPRNKRPSANHQPLLGQVERLTVGVGECVNDDDRLVARTPTGSEVSA